jgi:tRNA(Ile)-lysidine synthase
LAEGRCRFVAVTVDHGLRPPEESGGDAAFVEAYCKTLPNVECVVRRLERGAVAECAKARGRGVEDAARFLRYQVFEEVAESSGAEFVCLAHTKNDNLETILFRFLQGSGGAAAGGIQKRRGRFVRPLLDVSREDIERYLTELGVAWRTDATNTDTAYMRNRVRHLLMPQLDEIFPGWQTAVLAGAEKAADDAACIAANIEDIANTEDAEVKEEVFFSAPRAVRRELVYRMCERLEVAGRFPYRLVSAFISGETDVVSTKELTIEKKGGQIRASKGKPTGSEGGFFAIIEKCGVYQFPFGNAVVSGEPVADGVALRCPTEPARGIPVNLPICVRSRLPDDAIQTADGIRQNLNALFTNYGIPLDVRDRLPVVETVGGVPEIRFVCGEVAGYRNWKAVNALPKDKTAHTGTDVAYISFY